MARDSLQYWSLFSTWAALMGGRFRGLGACISRHVLLKISDLGRYNYNSDVQYQNPGDLPCQREEILNP